MLGYVWLAPLAMGLDRLIPILVAMSLLIAVASFAWFLNKSVRANEQTTQALVIRSEARAREAEAVLARLASSKLGNLVSPKLEDNSFELYLAYRHLGVGRLAEILDAVNGIYQAVYLQLWHLDQDKPGIPHDANASTDTHLSSAMKADPGSELSIEFAQTGDSIRFVMRAGWLPSISAKKGNVDIGLPRAAFAVGLSAMLVNTALTSGLTAINGIMDVLAKQRVVEMEHQELANKRLLYEKMLGEIHELNQRRKASASPGPHASDGQAELEKLLKATVYSDDITAVTVNSVLTVT